MNSKNQLVLTVLLVSIIILSLVAGTYAFMRAGTNNTNNMKTSIKTGTMELTFSDGNPSITGSLSLGYSTSPKELVLTNTGTLPATGTIEWKNLTNTYLKGSLTYTLKRKTSSTGSYTEVFTKEVPTGTLTTFPIYVEENMPAGAEYYYQIIITFNDLPDVDQTTDADASFGASFTVVSGAEGFTYDSWDKVITNVKAGKTDIYQVGDTKCLALTDYTTTNNNGCSNGEFLVRVANNSTPEECSTEGFSQTACGFVLEFVDIITDHNMNPAGEYLGTNYSNGWNKDGYPASSMKTFLTTELITKFPTNLQNAIIETPTVSSHGSADTNNFTSNETLYLLAPREIYGTTFTSIFDTSKDLTRQLDYYQNEGVTTSNYSGAIKKRNRSAYSWWTRSAMSYIEDTFYIVNHTGGCYNNYANTTGGVSPAFRI